MQSSRTRLLTYLVLFGLTLVCSMLAFGNVFFHPNGYLMAAGGDGLKTYFSSTWFIRFAEGAYNHGLAYPFGNHAVYADQNPLLSGMLRWFCRNVTDISGYTVGIINLTIMFGFFPCVFFLYKILRKSLLPTAFAVVGALVISFFSPQIERFTGHYSLSYVFYVPMLWYFLIRMFEGRKPMLWMGLYGSAILIFQFAHPYHFLIGAGLMFMYLLVHALQHRKAFRQNLRLYGLAMLFALIPVVILRGWLALTLSGADDFVKYPYGFLHYVASFESVFLPKDPPFLDVWNFFIDVRKAKWEGYGYVGFGGLLILVFALIKSGKYLLKKDWKKVYKAVLPTPLRTALPAAVLLLLVAMGFPFKLYPDSADWFSFVRQFRSIGRLVWPFYYVFMVYGFFFLYRLYRYLRMRGGKAGQIGIAIIALFVISWSAEAFILIKHERDYFLKNSTNRYHGWRWDYKQMLADGGHKADDFQAILALPYYHIGSEKFGIEDWNASFYSFALAKETGLPICNNYVARAPLSPSLKSIQMVSHPYIQKELIKEFPDQRPLLLMYTNDPMEAPQQRLVDLSEQFASRDRITLAKLELSAFDDLQESIRQEFAAKRDSLLFQEGDLYRSHDNGSAITEGYGDAWFETDLDPWTAKSFPKGKKVLFDGRLDGFEAGDTLEASIWVHLDLQSNYLPPLIVRQFDGEKEIDRQVFNMKFCTDIYRDWARAKIEFVFRKPGGRVELFADNKKRLTFDNLLIRRKGVEVFKEAEGGLVVNNYFIPKK